MVPLGPRTADFYRDCVNELPGTYGFALGTGVLTAVVALAIIVAHIRELRRAPPSVIRRLYCRIAYFPAVWAITSLIAISAPRAAGISELAQRTFEAIAISSFSTLIIFLLVHETRLRSGGGGGGECDKNTCEQVIEALATVGRRKHFGVPPLGCCFRPCLHAHDFQPRHLLRVQGLSKQFVFVVLIGAILQPYLALALPEHLAHTAIMLVKYAFTASALAAIYGLVVLYLASKHLLSDWATTSKFAAIKVAVAIAGLQDLILGFVIPKTSGSKRGVCWLEGGDEAFTLFCSQYLRAIESILLAYLIRRAFTVAEIVAVKDEHIDITAFKLELARCAKNVGTKPFVDANHSDVESAGSSQVTAEDDEHCNSEDHNEGADSVNRSPLAEACRPGQLDHTVISC